MILASFAFVHKHLNIIFICKVLYALDHWFARKRERKERKREKKRKKREKREKKREIEGKKIIGEKKDVQGQLLSICIQFSKTKTEYIGRNAQHLKKLLYL